MKILVLLFTFNLWATTQFVAVSDLNGSYGSLQYSKNVHNAVMRIIELNPSFVLITGDMVAGQKVGLDYEKMWDSFFKAFVVPLTIKNIPVLVTPGNHDASEYSKFSKEREIYKRRWKHYYLENKNLFSRFKLIDDSNYPFHYSFGFQNVQLQSIDATTTKSLSLFQMNKIRKNLKTNFYHKVVFSHMPFVPFAKKREQDYIHDKNKNQFLEIQSLGVDYFVSGHHHVFYPGLFSGSHVISNACLGSGARLLIGDSKRSQVSFSLFTVSESMISVDALVAPNFQKKIERKSLISKIITQEFTITRDDLNE